MPPTGSSWIAVSRWRPVRGTAAPGGGDDLGPRRWVNGSPAGMPGCGRCSRAGLRQATGPRNIAVGRPVRSRRWVQEGAAARCVVPRPAVTLSDEGAEGERAHCRRSERASARYRSRPQLSRSGGSAYPRGGWARGSLIDAHRSHQAGSPCATCELQKLLRDGPRSVRLGH